MLNYRNFNVSNRKSQLETLEKFKQGINSNNNKLKVSSKIKIYSENDRYRFLNILCKFYKNFQITKSNQDTDFF